MESGRDDANSSFDLATRTTFGSAAAGTPNRVGSYRDTESQSGVPTSRAIGRPVTTERSGAPAVARFGRG